MPVSLDKEPSECHGQNNNFDDDDNDDDEDYKRPLRAPKNRENVFGEIPGTLCSSSLQGWVNTAVTKSIHVVIIVLNTILHQADVSNACYITTNLNMFFVK